MSLTLAKALVADLPSGLSDAFNPWADRCDQDLPDNSPAAKLIRLGQHLDCAAKLILVGEAPGYAGCRHAGIAFTSEKQLLDGAIPRIDAVPGRLTSKASPFTEPSATTVWRGLYDHGLEHVTVLWNAVQLHPIGKKGTHSNRSPTAAELKYGLRALSLLREAFPTALIVAVGKKAEEALLASSLSFEGVRHPSYGGTPAFREGLRQIAARVNQADR